MKRITGNFQCVDAHGNDFSIIEYTEYVPVDPLERAGEENNFVPFLKEYATVEGEQCNRLGNGDRFIVFTGKGNVAVKVKK